MAQNIKLSDVIAEWLEEQKVQFAVQQWIIQDHYLIILLTTKLLVDNPDNTVSRLVTFNRWQHIADAADPNFFAILQTEVDLSKYLSNKYFILRE